MHFYATLAAAAAAVSLQGVFAVNLFVSSYDGNVTTLALDGSGNNYSLTASSRTQNCGSQPSWLVYERSNSIMYCMDENFAADPANPRAIFTSYKVDPDSGKLTVAHTSNLTTASSVSGVIFGDNKFMAVAAYSGQVSALTVDETTFNQAQVLDFVGKTQLGPEETAPHPHQTLLDPTGQYIISPDLGGDILRVFCWDNATGGNILEEHPPFKVKAGSGPRHAAFWKADAKSDSTDDVYLLVVTELANTLTTYKVAYLQEGGLNFTQVNTQNTFGGAQIPAGARAAEIQISSDGRYVTVSNRNDSSWKIDKYGSTNANQTEFSDSLATWLIGDDGELNFKQLWPAGGLFPRQFSFNKAGSMAAIGLQNSCRVVILARDANSGMLGLPIADIPLGDCTAGKVAGPTTIIWDD